MYTVLAVSPYSFKDNDRVIEGASIWLLPDYPNDRGIGYVPEKANITMDTFDSIGGLNGFKPFLNQKVEVTFDARGRFRGMRPAK